MEETLNNEHKETATSVQKDPFDNEQKDISNNQSEVSFNNDQKETTRSAQEGIFNNEQKEKSDKIESEMKRELLRLTIENDELKRINEEMKSHIEKKKLSKQKQ